MTSMLYSDRTIETKYFLLSNLKFKEKYGGFVRKQGLGFSNYIGEEIKEPIYETPIKTSNNLSKKRIKIKPMNLFMIKNKNTYKSLKLLDNYKLNINIKRSNKGLQTKLGNNFSAKKKINLNVIKMNFPYSKPFIKNSYSKLVSYNKNRDFIIAKSLEKNKKKMWIYSVLKKNVYSLKIYVYNLGI